uniref:Uncharacterized protein n=1 Tax=Anguilla anguilla TaxID=7936 RepID=A0A0E9Q4R4_ANGAN
MLDNSYPHRVSTLQGTLQFIENPFLNITFFFSLKNNFIVWGYKSKFGHTVPCF